MSSRLNLTFFAALAIQMLMIGATAAPLADGLNPMGDYEKMDKSLRNSLSSSSEEEIIPVIFYALLFSLLGVHQCVHAAARCLMRCARAWLFFSVD